MAEKRINLRLLSIEISSDGGEFVGALDEARKIAVGAIASGEDVDVERYPERARIAVKVQHG